ncbi:sensor histidine kinase [Pseudonocardia alaniniphila]|uniref:Histidine kinase n=1 Tax=Pseudonocardia alaniniphila TaxID=75291 RepID=A0ABS9TDM5_9PSEU|nr:histidine kinase [Pseudonocardia alaniniphila]MCH6166627.1 histidine kinase [Pseudonocardia alaniniphila]
MEISQPLPGAEERTVRAARRFGRIGLLMTIAWLLVVPMSMTLTGWPPAGYTAALLALFVVALGLHVWRIRELTKSLGRRAPAWFMIVAAAVGLAVSLVALAGSPVGFFWALVSGVLLGDIVGGLRARWTVVWVLGAVGVLFGSGYLVLLQAYGETMERSSYIPFYVAGLAAFFVGSMWTLDFERLWWLKAVTDLDDSRRIAAELATARERLRLADDLHDILGHALEVVAFKSELASRLQVADPERARSEMDEVQRVARESLGEVRALVRDARSTDLVTELAGARAVLESAGVTLVVRGDPTGLGPTARNVLGRVLREAMTNVLRHAQPNHCTIEIDVTDGHARLRVENDGALPAESMPPGTGLDALGRYLDEHAGRLDAGPGPDGTFHVDAVLPGAAR